MPYITPLFPAIPLSIPTVNYYDWLTGRPDLKNWPDFPLYIDGITGDERSVHAVLERFEHAATALATSPRDGGAGLIAGKGEMVGILSDNCLEYPILVFALLKLAIPIVFLPSQNTFYETVSLLSLSAVGVTSLFVSERMYPYAAAAAREVGLPEERIFILQGEVKGKASLPRLIEDVKSRGFPKVPSQTVRDDTLAYLVFSSGTTGLPKAVMISHRNLMFSALQAMSASAEIAKLFMPNKIPMNLAVLPWYHAMGAHAFIFRQFLSPSTAVVLPYWSVDLVVKAFSKFPITQFMMVPSIMQQVLNDPKLAKLDLASLDSMSSGAAYMPPDLRADLDRRAKKAPIFVEGYGMSECTYAALFLPLPSMLGGRVDPVRGMTGVLLPGLEARILREDGSDTDYDEIGELILRGPTTALGYWKNDRATEETFRDGWLYTGDRFRVDRQGRFFYVDRTKDVFKVSGKQVSPTEIENTIREHPSQFVTDVVVAGVKGGRLADELVPRAWIVLSNTGKAQGTDAVLAALDQWTRTRLSKHKWLRGGFQVIGEIPKLPTGKVLRRKLQEEYGRSERERTETKLLTKL